jgi:hypothetical protein
MSRPAELLIFILLLVIVALLSYGVWITYSVLTKVTWLIDAVIPLMNKTSQPTPTTPTRAPKIEG